MSRDFAIIRPTFWKRGTGKRLRGQKDAQILSLYLLSAPDAESIGIYHCELEEMAHHTGLTIDEVQGALAVLAEEDFAHFDSEHDLVWVPNLARERFGDTLAPKDKKRSWVSKEVRKLRQHRFVGDFHRRYGEAYGLDPDPGLVIPQAPSKPLPSPFQPTSNGASRPSEGTSSSSNSGYSSDSSCELSGGRCDLATRSRLYLQSDGNAQTIALEFGEPLRWPEVVATIELSGETPKPRTSRDSRVVRILEWLRDGYTADDLAEAVRLAKCDEWWRDKPLASLLSNPAVLADLRKPRAPKPGAKPIQPSGSRSRRAPMKMITAENVK